MPTGENGPALPNALPGLRASGAHQPSTPTVLWVFGGFRAEPTWTNFNDVWSSSDGKNWRELTTDTIWSPRHELSAYVHDGKLWVVAGNSWPLRNDVWSLEIKGLTFVTQPVIEEFVNSRYRYEARADFNSGGGPVSYRLVKGPSWIWMDAKTGIMTGVPDKTGDSEVSIEAFDAAGETARQTIHSMSSRSHKTVSSETGCRQKKTGGKNPPVYYS